MEFMYECIELFIILLIYISKLLVIQIFICNFVLKS